MPRARLYQIRAMLKGLSSEKRTLKRVPNRATKTINHEHLDNIRFQLQAMNFFYGMVRGRSFRETCLSSGPLHPRAMKKLTDKIIEYFKYYLEYFYYDPENPMFKNMSKGQIERQMINSVMKEDITEWLTNRDYKLFKLPEREKR